MSEQTESKKERRSARPNGADKGQHPEDPHFPTKQMVSLRNGDGQVKKNSSGT
jgi:hypothetical protein